MKKSRGSDAFSVYVAEISRYPLLSHREEITLSERIAEEDPEALDQMIHCNLRLVVKIARDFRGATRAAEAVPMEDLVSEGNMGLIVAAQLFNPDLANPTRFNTYASHWIKQAMRVCLSRSARLIRVPGHAASLASRWRKASRLIANQLGRPAANEEIAAALGLPPNKVAITLEALAIYDMVADATSGEPGDHEDRGAMIPDDDVPGPERVDDRDELQALFAELEALDSREAMVIRARYGLEGGEPRTLRDLASELGISKERVRQIEQIAVSKLTGRFA